MKNSAHKFDIDEIIQFLEYPICQNSQKEIDNLNRPINKLTQ